MFLSRNVVDPNTIYLDPDPEKIRKCSELRVYECSTPTRNKINKLSSASSLTMLKILFFTQSMILGTLNFRKYLPEIEKFR